MDLGTSSIKCGCLTSNEQILTKKQEKFPLVRNGNSYEIDVDLFFNTVESVVLQCLSEKVVQDRRIAALLITGQANTFVPVDNDFKPLCNGVVWLDNRADQEADFLKGQFPDYSKYAGFRQPLAGMFASKLLWLKKNEPEVFQNAKFFPLINEYLAYRLTNQFFSDITSFGMTGMYDFRKNDINDQLLRILGLTKYNFPKIEQVSKRGALITRKIANDWHIFHRSPVYLCGNDQCTSASGSGLNIPGDVTINFGTALVIFSITEEYPENLELNQIAGKYPVSNYYFVLNYEPDFGIIIKYLKEKLFEEDSYDQLFQTYMDNPGIEERIPHVSMCDLDLMAIDRPNQFCAGILKYYVNSLKRCVADIEKKMNINTVFLSGAISESKVLKRIIDKEIKHKVIINNQEFAGLVGALKIYLSENEKSKIYL
ncbi:xylulokinase [Allomuricauda sp. CP2A]|uniref:xylulokinase n=1 Tax=Allomuricauda sp. CP2A TaxID=1848189 RepID=UPI0021003628|nr:FGGY-family carbohydrate kinase [Muricauda sp. CP2A]